MPQSKMKYNIDIFTLCYNEMDIIPFVIQYWKRIARHVYVYDNGSTDGSIEYLKKYNFIDIIPYKSDGLNDLKYIEIKNNVWKNSTADFVIICDMDECLYSEKLNDIFDYMKNNKQTISHTWFLETISEHKPEYQQNKLYHELDNVFIKPGNINDKCIIFDPKEIKSINYKPGAHTCNPEGNVSYYDKQEQNPIKVIHIKNLSLDYKLNRHIMYKNRLSSVNIKNGYGIHYKFPLQMQIKEFNDTLAEAKKYNEIIKK